MIPDPPIGRAHLAGGEGIPARDDAHEPSRAGHIHCAACDQLITPDQYATAWCWCGPIEGTTVAAHGHCLGIFNDIARGVV